MNIIKRIFYGRQLIKKKNLPEKQQYQIEFLFSELEYIINELRNAKIQIDINRMLMVENKREFLNKITKSLDK